MRSTPCPNAVSDVVSPDSGENPNAVRAAQRITSVALSKDIAPGSPYRSTTLVANFLYPLTGTGKSPWLLLASISKLSILSGTLSSFSRNGSISAYIISNS